VLYYSVHHDAKEYNDLIGKYQRDIPSLRGLIQVAHAESAKKVSLYDWVALIC
jgi:predicted RNA-binding protein YlqC (UPF0109 family)